MPSNDAAVFDQMMTDPANDCDQPGRRRKIAFQFITATAAMAALIIILAYTVGQDSIGQIVSFIF